MKLETNKILQGDSLEVLKTLPDESINMVITSPPYWALRDYGVDGQLGLEPTFEEYITKLCNIFDEVKRVLKKDGTCWVNMGDTYNSGGNYRKDGSSGRGYKYNRTEYGRCQVDKKKQGLPDKCLCQIPSRFAIEMTNRGWILRNEIIWHKPNCMPSSVKDRFTVDFEKIFFFVKSKKYWFEQQLEPHKECSIKARNSKLNQTNNNGAKMSAVNVQMGDEKRGHRFIPEQGRNKRSVWTITTKPYKEAHFAVYPPELIETPIKAGCPRYVCKKCGKAREKTYKQIKHKPIEIYNGQAKKDYQNAKAQNPSDTKRRVLESMRTENKVIGLTDCGCNAGFEPGVVLDPFIGSGTTAVVAKSLGRNYIGIELNPDYIKLAEQRLGQEVLL